MSDAGDMITALLADAGTAIPGVTTSLEPVMGGDINNEDLPYLTVLATDYASSPLAWQQESRVWTFTGRLYNDGGTREAMQLDLEAFRDQVRADPTLGGSCDFAVMVASVPHSAGDAKLVVGDWAVRCERVV